MGQVIVNRPPRRSAPLMPTGDVLLEPPPEVPPVSGNRGWLRLLMILPMAAGAAAMGLMMGAGRAGPLMYVAGAMYGVSILGMMAMMFVGQGGPAKKEMVEVRRQFMRRLSQLRAQVRETIAQQQTAIHYRHPAAGELWGMIGGARLWERRRGDADFGVLRMGVGPQALATPLVPPQTRPVDELDPLCAMALKQFVTTYSVVPDLPVAIALRDFARVYLRGPHERAQGLARAMLAHAATFHSPDDLLIGFCVAGPQRPAWEWAKWLPHTQHPGKSDAVGPLRLFASTVTALEVMLDDVLGERMRFTAAAGPNAHAMPHVIVVVDGGSVAGSDHLVTDSGIAGATILDLTTQPPRLLGEATAVLTVDESGTLTGATTDGKTDVGRADQLHPVEAEVLARELGPLRLSAALADGTVHADLGLADLLELDDPYQLDPARIWAARPSRDRLRVPFGVDQNGWRVELDLKESAQDGMGPHGLLVGATGSGKSELLRTLVLALAVTHGSESLNFVLVDFKGGATFNKLDLLPHTSAVITNLADEMPMVDRMLDAIQGELVRRQELLRESGGYASQRDYERARAAGVPLAPLPSLLLICDEFSELLTARPEFIDMFVQIGRVGRSLGIHLLLASQRLEEGRLRGLETHLSYRLGLRTFSSMESRAVLGVPDAYELPRSPGHGYLRVGTEELIRFRAAYVSGRYRRDGSGPVLAARTADVVRDYGTHYQTKALESEPAPAVDDGADEVMGETLLDVLVDRLRGQGPPAHQVWLPPLDAPPPLGNLLPPLVRSGERGLTVAATELQAKLRAAVGVIDKPFEQRRDPLWLELAGAKGNVIVVGGPRSGKSTLLRSLMCGLALTHTPREVQFYCLDFGGGAMAALADLPHVGGVAGRTEVGRVRRTIAELYSLLQAREAHFAANAIDGIEAFRRSGGPPGVGTGDTFLFIDGWAVLREQFEDLEPIVTALANRGLGYGIHVVVTAARWLEVRAAQRDALGTRLELRLGDPGDSAINRRAAVNVPEEAPGRGLTPEGQHFLAALPRVDGRADVETLADGLAELVKHVRASWAGADAPAVRLLPNELPYSALPEPQRGRLPIGIAETDLQPVYLDFDAEPHALLFGDIESGKSSFLRGLARSIASSYSPAQARVILVDQRRSLLGSVGSDHLIGYGSSQDITADIIGQAATVMRERLPGPDVTPEQLRARTWWKGPELYVLVDDYDLVVGGMGNPLEPLLEFLPQGRDIGLHVVVARRSGGAGRALFDPLLARIRELASPGMLMSGSKEEGPIFGTVSMQPLPPGRAWLITRRHGARLVQLAWTPPAS